MTSFTTIIVCTFQLCSIMGIRNTLTDVEKDRLLFVHSFSGCDTVSGIYRQSKKGLLQKLCKTDEDLAARFGTGQGRGQGTGQGQGTGTVQVTGQGRGQGKGKGTGTWDREGDRDGDREGDR